MSTNTSASSARIIGGLVALSGLGLGWASITYTSGVYLVAGGAVGLVMLFTGLVGLISGKIVTFDLIINAVLEALSVH